MQIGNDMTRQQRQRRRCYHHQQQLHNPRNPLLSFLGLRNMQYYYHHLLLLIAVLTLLDSLPNCEAFFQTIDATLDVLRTSSMHQPIISTEHNLTAAPGNVNLTNLIFSSVEGDSSSLGQEETMVR